MRTCLLIFLPFFLLGQGMSSTREFIEKSNSIQINKDWSVIAEFYSGLGESVKFYPIEVINLNTKERIKAVQVDMNIKQATGFKLMSQFVGTDEIKGFVEFIETHVSPNLDVKLTRQSSEYIFETKEITLSYLIYERVRRISIRFNNCSMDEKTLECEKQISSSYQFWTESNVAALPRLLPVLNAIR
jgi:hypothetical protein